jgi:predicted secreted protein
MATGTPIPGKSFLIQLGDGGTPTEIFDFPCGLTTKGAQFSKSVSETVMPDCDDADVVPWVKREAGSKSLTVSGEGKIARGSLGEWRAFFEQDESKNVRFVVPGTAAQGGGRWQGAFQLTSFSVSAVHGETADVSIEMVNDGDVAWTAAA